MIPLCTAQEMQQLEREAIQDWGIPAIVLQEHAALGALALVPGGAPLQVLAGPGNNGGDALALARLARLQGRSVTVWTLDPTPCWKGDAALQARLWEGLGGTYHVAQDPRAAVKAFQGWVVDGLFGLGTRLPLPPAALAWVEALQAAGSGFQVLALDLPSGLDPGSAEVTGPAIRADLTAAFGQYKICHGLQPARGQCGELSLIRLPLRGDPASGLRLLERPGRELQGRWNTHKRDFGHVAIRAGTLGMGGAAVLAALGALRMGAGLVTVLPDEEVRAEVAAQVPEAMVSAWQGRVPEDVDVLLVGPGGVSELPAWQGPLVLDASALRPGEGAQWMARPQTVITPHPGEFKRLFGAEPALEPTVSGRLARVRQVATGPGVLILKGAQTLLAGGGDDLVEVNATGHPGLSTGGSGDFLAGMVAARVAQWVRRGARADGLRRVAGEAVWLHGAAADRLGKGPVLVRELGASLAGLLREENGGCTTCANPGN